MTVVHGDASSEFLLEREGISECDALVTLTGVDEMNIVISLFGNSRKVPQIITKLGRLSNNSILDTLSVGSTISPKELCCNDIVRYVRAIRNQTGAAQAVNVIADGQAEAMEFVVAPTTRNLGVPLKDLKLKKGILIAVIVRDSKVIIPEGSTSLERGDNVIVVARDSGILDLNDIYDGSGLRAGG